MLQHKCKICRSNQVENIEFCRFYLGWRYEIIIDVYRDEIENLNKYNLSNHFNYHCDHQTISFYKQLRDADGISEASGDDLS